MSQIIDVVTPYVAVPGAASPELLAAARENAASSAQQVLPALVSDEVQEQAVPIAASAGAQAGTAAATQVIADQPTIVSAAAALAQSDVGLLHQTAIPDRNQATSENRETGVYYDFQNGTKVENENWNAYVGIHVSEGAHVTLGAQFAYTNNSHVCFWNAAGEYVSGLVVTPRNTAVGFDVPIGVVTMTVSLYVTGAQYIKVSYPDSSAMSGPPRASIPPTRLMDIPGIDQILEYVSGPNLLNVEESRAGKFVNALSGNLETNANYSFTVIPVEASTVYTVQLGSGQSQIAELDATGTYVTGQLWTGGGQLTTSVSTHALAVSWITEQSSPVWVVEGESGAWSPYGSGNLYRIPDRNTNIVSSTIQEAIDNARQGDTIIIPEGIYHESITLNKDIILRGAGPNRTIVSYGHGDYAYPPLNAHRGTVIGVGFEATFEEQAEGAYGKAYAMHYDFSDCRDIHFIDCWFRNYGKHTVGIGLKPSARIKFSSCRIENVWHTGEVNVAVFMHDHQTVGTEQRIEFVNCSIINNSASASTIVLQSQEVEGSSATALFHGNVIKNAGGVSTFAMVKYNDLDTGQAGWKGTANWALDEASGLNSDVAFDA